MGGKAGARETEGSGAGAFEEVARLAAKKAHDAATQGQQPLPQTLVLHHEKRIRQTFALKRLRIGVLREHEFVDMRGEAHIGEIDPDSGLCPTIWIAGQQRTLRKHLFKVFIDHG